MKHLMLSLILLVGYLSRAADPVDSAVVSRIFNDGNAKVVTVIKGQTKEISDTIKAMTKPIKTSVQALPQSTFWSSLLCFLPVLFFLLLLVSIAVKLRRDNISLADFLVDKEQQVALKKEDTKVKLAVAETKETLVKAAGSNPDAVRAVVTNLNQVDDTPPPNPPDPSQSTSRLIVFITGITSLLIAVCMTSFFFYRWSLGDQNVDFGKLSTVLYGLGLGVLPYGFTKIASVLK